jgi:hypothetical protein
MHGLGGHRGIVKTRALSFVLYILAIITGVLTLPLVVAGPSLVRRILPESAEFLVQFYWPTVIVLSIGLSKPTGDSSARWCVSMPCITATSSAMSAALSITGTFRVTCSTFISSLALRRR